MGLCGIARITGALLLCITDGIVIFGGSCPRDEARSVLLELALVDGVTYAMRQKLFL